MKQIDIKIYQIAQTSVCPNEVQQWLQNLGVTDKYCDGIYEESMDEDTITNPALLIALAAKRCYMSFEAGLNPNVTKVRKDWTDYIDNILKQGHGSVLEHASFTFAIEGVSRVFTGEMNRHRAGWAISEGSMRFIRFNDIPYWVPTSITLTPDEQRCLDIYGLNPQAEDMDADDLEHHALAVKKFKSQKVFEHAFKDAEGHYAALQGIWKDELGEKSKFAAKKHVTSMMRRVIPMGVATGGVWTGNIRALRHVMAMRASEAAEEEIFHVFSRIATMMVAAQPMLCGDFHQIDGGFWAPKYPKV